MYVVCGTIQFILVVRLFSNDQNQHEEEQHSELVEIVNQPPTLAEVRICIGSNLDTVQARFNVR